MSAIEKELESQTASILARNAKYNLNVIFYAVLSLL